MKMFTQIGFISIVLYVLVSCDSDQVVTKKVTDCLNAEITAANAEWKLTARELNVFTNVIDQELQKEPFCRKNPEQKARILQEIHTATKKNLNTLDDTTIDKLIDTLKIKGRHCATNLKVNC